MKTVLVFSLIYKVCEIAYQMKKLISFVILAKQLKNLVVIVFILFLFGSCKKDHIDVVNIAGNVKNNCTD